MTNTHFIKLLASVTSGKLLLSLHDHLLHTKFIEESHCAFIRFDFKRLCGIGNKIKYALLLCEVNYPLPVGDLVHRQSKAVNRRRNQCDNIGGSSFFFNRKHQKSLVYINYG